MRLEVGIRFDVQVRERQVQPARLHMVGVEIDRDDDYVAEVGGGLDVADDRVVVDAAEAQIPVVLQSRVFPPDPIHPRDEAREAVRLGQISA